MALCIKEKDDSISWEQLTELLHDAYSSWVKQGIFYPAAVQSPEQTKKRAYAAYCERSGVLVALVDGCLAGTISYSMHMGRRWYEGQRYMTFCQFGVYEKYKKHGVGGALLAELEKMAGEFGADNMVASTAEPAQSLLNWYHKRGYVNVNFLSWQNTPYYSVVFAKPLSGELDAVRCEAEFTVAKKFCKRRFRANGKPSFIRSLYYLPRSALGAVLRLLACFIRKVRCFSEKRKNILLYCNGEQMQEHLEDFYRCVRNMPDVKFWLFFASCRGKELRSFAAENNIACVGNIRKLKFIPFSLIVSADFVPDVSVLGVKKLPASIYVNHGFHIVGRGISDKTYAYDVLASKIYFDAFFEPNRRIAEYVKNAYPALSDSVVCTGWKYAHRERTEVAKRDYYRKKLGFRDSDTVVFAVSTWGENSLFHVLGDEFFDVAQRMEKKNWHFVLSAHPKEYTDYMNRGYVIGSRIDEQEKYGMTVRKPGTNWIDYLAASDIVLSDYSTITESAINAGKKVLLSRFPDSTIWSQSVMAKALPYLTVLDDVSLLEASLEKLRESSVSPQLQELAAETYVSREQYEQTVVDTVNRLLKNI